MDYSRFFREADRDRSGTLSLNELIGALRQKGYRGSDNEIRRWFRSVDTSGDNQISYDEYCQAMGLVPPEQHKGAAMRQVFREFDRNGDGVIDRKELKEVFKEMGKHFSDEELRRMIALADKDHSGTLDYDEFIEQVCGRGT